MARHWIGACGSKDMPAWSDIQPARIAPQLPIVWSYRYDTASEEFVGRLAGDQISAIFGKGFRNLPLAQAQPAKDFSWIYALCKRVVAEPAIYHYTGRVFEQLGRYGYGERIMMPLSSDGRTSDGILGATLYQMGHYEPAVSRLSPREDGQWFPILTELVA